MNITVLKGGNSPERAISLLTGAAIEKALLESGHQVQAIDIESIASVLTLPNLHKTDIIFPALHGGQGEDGHLQAILDVMQIPYALSGHAASALAMDKSSTKRVMRAAGIPTADWLQVCWDRNNSQSGTIFSRDGAEGLTLDRIFTRASKDLGFPLVIKLNSAGSSVGVAIVHEPNKFEAAFTKVVEASDTPQIDLIIEKFIPGRELTATILLGRRLPLLEIRPQDGFYDYENKYTAGACDYLVPAPVNSPLYEQISADALRLFELIGCRGVARVDFLLDKNDYYCLEINTIPGMTEHSLVPKSAAAVGISFPALVEDLCRAALT